MPQIYAFIRESPTIPCIFDSNTPFATSMPQPNSPRPAVAAHHPTGRSPRPHPNAAWAADDEDISRVRTIRPRSIKIQIEGQRSAVPL